jgi:hypothetical protein
MHVKATENYKLIIRSILFNIPFLCIMSTGTDSDYVRFAVHTAVNVKVNCLVGEDYRRYYCHI